MAGSSSSRKPAAMRFTRVVWMRWLAIDRRLRDPRRPFPSAAELLQALRDEDFRVEQRTLESDLEQIRLLAEPLGCHLRYNRRHRGYAYSQPDFSLAGVPLTAQHLEALQWAEALLAAMPPALSEPFADAVNQTLAALRATRIAGAPEQLRRLIHAEPQGTKGLRWMEALLEALARHRQVRLHYRPHSYDAAVQRTVHPLQLREFQGLWYLVANRVGEAYLTIYALDRITVLELLDTPADLHTHDVEAYFRHTYGITVREHGAPPAEPIRFTVTAYQAKYLAAAPWHASQTVVAEDAERCTLSLNVHWNYELCMRLLSLGRHLLHPTPAEVLLRQAEFQPVPLPTP